MAQIIQDKTHGTYHLSSAANVKNYEVQRTNNFEFVVTDLDNLKRAGGDTAHGNITNGQEVLRLSVVEANVPHFNQGIIEIKRGNTIMKAAGTPTFDAGSLRVNDYIGADTKSVLLAWQALSYDVTNEHVGQMADYKKNCTLVEYTPDYKMVRYWDLIGCWVSGISEDSFNFETNDKKTITATIQFDRAIMHLPD